MRYRFFLDLAVAISIIFGWWFIALPLTVIGVGKMPFYFEVILAGLGYDALYGLVSGGGYRSYLGIITGLTIIILVYIARKLVR